MAASKPRYTAAQKKRYAARKRKGSSTAAQKKFQLRRPKASVTKALQPILETKKYLGFTAGAIPGPTVSYLSNTGPTVVLVPGAFTFMQPEDNIPSGGVEGSDIFSRFVSEKLKITYPTNNMSAEDVQVMPVEVIWGWCKPLNYTSLTTPLRGTVSRQAITDHVMHQVAEEFNEKLDVMKFNDKQRRNYNIIGRKKMMPNNNTNIIQNTWVPDLPSGFQQKGGPQSVFKTCSWPMNKKVELTASNDTTGSADPFLYPNQAYIPFIVIFNPSYAAYDANADGNVTQIELIRNSCHWFNDA